MIGIVQRFSAIGALPDDTEDERIRKGALTLASGIVSVLAPIWIVTYLFLDLPVSATIPLVYVVISVASLVALARTKRYRVFRTTQLALLLRSHSPCSGRSAGSSRRAVSPCGR